jgi:glycosyltransferase involved in cell wall biosynthesis
MKILLDNVDITSSSGPNSFAKQLTLQLTNQRHQFITVQEILQGHNIIDRLGVNIPDVHLAFIQQTVNIKNVPLIQRLDGIYYNNDSRYGDWWIQNQPISTTYSNAHGIIYQSNFSKRLVETFFEKKDEEFTTVIGNGVNLDIIKNVNPMQIDDLQDKIVWGCASNWRPHKRLSENIRYFLEVAPSNAIFLIAGDRPQNYIEHERIFWLGNLNWNMLISLYKCIDTFVHLAYHDNCPNVIVDARAAGCKIVCASCSGSPEIAGPDAVVIDEDDWDPQPIELYNPPKLDFTRARKNNIDSSIDIRDVVTRYIDFIKRFVK